MLSSSAVPDHPAKIRETYHLELWPLPVNAIASQPVAKMSKILIVDDEEIILKVARMTLERAGHAVVEARSASEAQLISSQLDVLDLLIVDHYVGPESGGEIAGTLMVRWPDLKVLHISGLPRGRGAAENDLPPNSRFLPKPFKPKELIGAVAELLG